MDTDLSNTIGIFIAFATLMLLYSIVVTSLVQATQAILRLRGRNLWRGLTRILEDERTDPTEDPSGNAFKVLSDSASAVFSVVDNPSSLFEKVLGPDVTWLDAGQLRAALDRSNKDRRIGFTEEQISNIVSKFGRTEKASRKRFQFWTRMLSIAWAAFIAVYFQLSTPDLLNRLSSSETARAQLIDIAEKATKEEKEEAGEEVNQDQLDVDSTKAKSMFYLEPGRDRNFLYHKKGEGDDAQWIVEWNDLSGVIITVLLLALGAPFWFNMLKSAVNLRDALSPDDAKSAPTDTDVDQQIKETTETIAKTDDPLAKAALKSKLGDLRVLKAKMLSV